jgi:hypothetical protein
MLQSLEGLETTAAGAAFEHPNSPGNSVYLLQNEKERFFALGSHEEDQLFVSMYGREGRELPRQTPKEIARPIHAIRIFPNSWHPRSAITAACFQATMTQARCSCLREYAEQRSL